MKRQRTECHWVEQRLASCLLAEEQLNAPVHETTAHIRSQVVKVLGDGEGDAVYEQLRGITELGDMVHALGVEKPDVTALRLANAWLDLTDGEQQACYGTLLARMGELSDSPVLELASPQGDDPYDWVVRVMHRWIAHEMGEDYWKDEGEEDGNTEDD